MNTQQIQNTQNESFEIDQASLLQIAKSINAILDDDVTITLTNEGLFFREMDKSHVALLDMALSNNIFEKYEITKDLKFGFNASLLLKIVRSLNKKQSVKLEIFESRIQISQKESKMDIPRLENSVNDCPLPKIPYDARIVLPGKMFKEICQKAEIIGDYITLITSDSSVTIKSKGDMGESSETKSKDDFMELQVRENSETTYSLEYLKEFLKSLTKDSIVTLEYSSRKPLRISTKISTIGSIHFYLAPRIES